MVIILADLANYLRSFYTFEQVDGYPRRVTVRAGEIDRGRGLVLHRPEHESRPKEQRNPDDSLGKTS